MRELGSPEAVKSRKTLPKSLKKLVSGGEIFEGVSASLLFSFFQKSRKEKKKKEKNKREEERKERDTQSQKKRHGFGCFCHCTSPPETAL